MNSTDKQILDSAIEWLDGGWHIALATVTRTWGSSPRPPGSWAVLRDDGTIVGSVSGGCVEDDLVRRVREGLLSNDQPLCLSYGVSKDEATRFGLPCGGSLQIVVEPAPDPAGLKLLLQRMDAGLMTARTLDVATGQAMLEDANRNAPLTWDGKRLTTVHGPQNRLLIIGAAQVSGYLASMAQALDYAVSVCDPREEYAAAWQVASVPLISTMPDDAVVAFKPDSGSAIVALTHDPKLDDLALLEALRSPAFYVGALGSRLNAAKRRERMMQHCGVTEAEMQRLHAPVGLRIGSRTPPEIAVAILAEMIAVKNAAHAGSASLCEPA
ncbi:MAG: XdhC family protein [Sulfurimicrobium sp.]|jgi:xanthine dehydrogenase accessory factor|nr:XdhC family protein [Sulfurimicrobium sp.]MDZ7656057.1 XdhC family protein [Sulfurimicrobium sp.]